MSTPKIIAGLAGALILGAAVGAAGRPAEVVRVDVPGPTQIVERSVDVPGPTVYVDAIPEDCQQYIDELLNEDIVMLGFVNSVYDAYLDYPDENLEQFGQRVETLLTDFDVSTLSAEAPSSACDR